MLVSDAKDHQVSRDSEVVKKLTSSNLAELTQNDPTVGQPFVG